MVRYGYVDRIDSDKLVDINGAAEFTLCEVDNVIDVLKKAHSDVKYLSCLRPSGLYVIKVLIFENE